MKRWTFREQAAIVQIALLVVIMVAGCVSAVSTKVFVSKLHMDNVFLRAILPSSDFRQIHVPHVQIEWQKKYPFDAAEEEDKTPSKTGVQRLVSINEILKTKIQHGETMFTESLPDKDKVKEYGCRLENAVGWKIVPLKKGTSYLVPGERDYWSASTPQKDIASGADGLKRLSDFCQQQGVGFLYVQAPGRIQKDKDAFIEKYHDYSNENTDRLMDRLRDLNINYVDFRQVFADLSPDEYHQLFFRTDHHWKPETALWAARYIGNLLNEEYGFQMETQYLQLNNFNQDVRSQIFLGSIGKRITLAKTVPDDLLLLSPKYPVDMEYNVPEKAYDERGDFSVMLDMTQVEHVDYYAPGVVQEPYGVYCHGDYPLAVIHSYRARDHHKVLVIKDSYGRPFSTFLGTIESEVDMIDPRAFFGSIESYIRETKPDMVLVVYSIGQINSDAPLSLRANLFDLR